MTIKQATVATLCSQGANFTSDTAMALSNNSKLHGILQGKNIQIIQRNCHQTGTISKTEWKIVMRTLSLFLACNSMRYNGCAAVSIGDNCEAAEEGLLECTKKPSSTVDFYCIETLSEDHDIAQCTEQDGDYIWTYYASCSGGRQAITDGVEYDCIYDTVYDCDEEYY